MATMRGAMLATACTDQASVSSSHFSSRSRMTGQYSALGLARLVPCQSKSGAERGLAGVRRGLRLDNHGLFASGLRDSQSLPRLGGGGEMEMASGKSRSVIVQAKNSGIEAPERILAALGYLLPLFDGIQYGRYFFLQFPVAEAFLRPLYPLLAAYKGFPYSNFIAFFSLYLLVVRNQSVSRYVRFNAMQAVVLDVLLIFPTLVERTFAPRGGVGFELLIILYNTVFLFLVSCFLFGVVSCILGKTPRLPIVADAADAQV